MAGNHRAVADRSGAEVGVVAIQDEGSLLRFLESIDGVTREDAVDGRISTTSAKDGAG